MRRVNPLFVLLGLLLLGGGLVAMAGCASYDADRGVSIGPAASSVRVGEVEDALLKEQAERQEGDKALRDSLSETASALRSGIDPAPILAQANANAEARDARQAAELEKKITDARSGEIDWLEVLGISVGATGAGGVALNRYRNKTRKKDLAVTAATGKAPAA